MVRPQLRDPVGTARSGTLSRVARRGVVLAVLAAGLGGCMSTGDITGSVTGDSGRLPAGDAELRSYADTWAKRFDKNPGDATASLNYARALRALGRYSEAVAVLQAASIKNPGNPAIVGAYGKVLADVGRFSEAADVLGKAHSPERPDWSILSAQGTVADQLGNFAQAQSYYAAALKISPEEPTVLSNLGLSYALARRLPDAETTLRRAAANPKADTRVRHNLALVLGLQGKFDEASTVLQHDLSPADALADVASIRQMIAQSDTWREIRKADAGPNGSRRPRPKAAVASSY